MAKAKTIKEATRENWIESTFPEWGTWLNEAIAAAQVPAKNFKMWWLGNTGIWLKTHEGTNILIDLWNGTGKQSHGDGLMKKGHQMMRMSGVKALQPNLRQQPFVIDPYQMKDVDALLVSHIHSDHLDIHTAAAVMENSGPDTKFIGPKDVVKTWIKWGVPKKRTIVVQPGDEVVVKSVKIKALEAFDRTALLTVAEDVQLKGKMPPDMNDLAVNFLVQTSGGNLYHGADSHMSNLFTKHGNENQIDVEVINYGENPRGLTDKMTSIDVLRSAEDLKAKVVIPVHYDIWTNFAADPQEIMTLWRMKQEILQYSFHPFIWRVGDEYTYPQDSHKFRYHHDRGFDDAFLNNNDLPFPSFL
ncbi:L-ascorbate 6-phosphate lactonase [Fructobacillus pseudoficulneus]|uniref:L-ascorbate 6-phosphate lactonase n=1 Tax=Fructobacillus pseudoficulneus TaxID=220714 RepID=A0A3F3H838_9LACO|nr:L-ascorbate 6-phosphate lactonase [Fructobacillus pseudoficulneus]GAP02563.1 L-ascorbate 6-phosphate lactonase [Fructobacillus pseudoficulneus]SEH38227.1 L-ascorbate 6-phosphate lactonase [Fructobacillus pseudoficulneus]